MSMQKFSNWIELLYENRQLSLPVFLHYILLAITKAAKMSRAAIVLFFYVVVHMLIDILLFYSQLIHTIRMIHI